MTRILSAAVLVGVLLAALWLLPPWVTVALAAACAAMAAAELGGLAAHTGATVPPAFLAAAAAMVTVAFAAGASVALVPSVAAGRDDLTGALLLALTVAAGSIALASGQARPATIGAAAVLVMGPLYIGLPLGAIARVRVEWGPEAATLPLVIVAVSDSAQYYAGRLLGRRQLAPVISPAKTVEGALGGLAAAGVVGLTLGPRWMPGVSLGAAVVIAVAIAGAGLLGDLFESQLKRSAGVKDSGRLIPGHGGLLDRLDSHLFAVPVYYLALRYLVMASQPVP
jgi:phosphatidate cytidylyltransferase